MGRLIAQRWWIHLLVALPACDPGVGTLSARTGPGATILFEVDAAADAPESEDARAARPLPRDASPPAPDAAVLERDAALPPPDAFRPPPDAFRPAPPPPDMGLPEACAGGPLALPLPGCRPSPPASTGDLAQDCVNRINQLRAECQCLPPLRRWQAGEACADTHAEYDSTRSPHAGFQGRICAESGFGQNECPGWGSTRDVIVGCLQQMWDEGPGEPFQAHGHYLNMTNGRFSQVACGFYTTPAGQVWAVQNFQ
ncbi:MAG: CAP domain-containing protein [bacterium]